MRTESDDGRQHLHGNSVPAPRNEAEGTYDEKS